MAYIPSGCTVKEYEEVVYSGKCDNKLYLSFGGVELENADEYCEKITGTNKILSNGNNYFSLDNFVSRELNITLHNIEIEKIIDPVNVKIGTNVNGTYIYVPIGIFNIQDSPKSAKGTIKIQLRDNSVKFDFNYNAKPLIDLNGGSATKRQILEDICTKAGVKHKIPYFLGEDDEIGIYDSTVKARIYVSYIAEQASVFPTIDRDGDLIFVDIKDQKKVVTGETINLLKATNRDLAKLTLDGRSTQETRDGKNFFNSTLVKNVTRSGVTWLVQDDGGINISGSNTYTGNVSNGVGTYSGTDPIIELDPTKTYTFSFSGDFDTTKVQFESRGLKNNALAYIGNLSSGLITITGFSAITYLNFYARVGATDINETIYLMIEEGSTAAPYEQYGVSPSLDYPSEIESIEGKNICDVSTSQIGLGWNLVTNSARAICNVKVKSNTTYSLSFASISGIDGLYFCEKVNSTDTAIIGNVVQITASRQITTTSTTNYLVIQLNKANISMSDIEAIKLQIEKGSIITGYVPYGTIQYKQIGEQLYNCKDVLVFSDGVIIDDDNWITITCDNASGTSTKYFDFKTKLSNNVKPNTNYDLFIEIKSISGNGAIHFINNKLMSQMINYNGNSLANLSVGTIKYTATTKGDFTGCTSLLNSYAAFSAGQSGSITFRISILKQNVKTTDNFVYEPYKETMLNIDLQGNKLCSLSNGVKDELIVENGRAKIIKNVQEDLLDGVNKKFTSIDLRESKTFLVCNYKDLNIKTAVSESETIPLSNKFRPSSMYKTWNGVIQYGVSQSSNDHYLQFSFPKTIDADLTLNGLNTWLVNNNTKVQYQLEMPIEIDLGEVTQPKTFEGVNNISNSEDTNMSVEYLSPKEPKKLPIDYIENYENGEPYEISKTIYESGIIKFEDGTETNDILYLNSANPYISNLEQVKKINENLKGLKLNSFSVSKIKGNLLIDPYDLIEVESENGKFVTLGQNTFTYDGSIMQSFSTEIGKEIRKTNVSASSEATYRKLAKTEIDNVKGEIRLYVEEQVSQVEDQINGESGINENLELIKNSIETIKSSMLKQTAEQFEMLFKQTGIEEIVNSVDNLTKDNNTKLNELEQWIRFKGASIELGRSDSQVKLMLQNDEIYFMTGGVKTGRIKDNMIFIENSIVTNSFKQGLSSSGQDKALWEERVETSGNKNLRWIGGAY